MANQHQTELHAGVFTEGTSVEETNIVQQTAFDENRTDRRSSSSVEQ